MTDDYQELDGVGPAREEKLNDKGYETYEDLGEADHEELAEAINRLSEDAALDLVVQAQNAAELEEAEVEEEPEVAENDSDDADADSDEDGAEDSEGEEAVTEVAEADYDDTDDEAESESDDTSDEPEEYAVTIEFGGEYEYDSFYHTLVEERCNLRRTNRAGLELYETMLDSMRESSPDGTFTVELTEDELNDLHNAILEQRIDYQGENLIDYMDSLRRVENRINSLREEFLF